MLKSKLVFVPVRTVCVLFLVTSTGVQVRAQQPQTAAPTKAAPLRRPPLFFREEWSQPASPGERPASQEAVSNTNLELKLYGHAAKEILLSGNAANEANPLNLWTGVTTAPIAVALREKNNYVDLTGL